MTDAITSTRNPRIKEVTDLRDARTRRETGLILIDGLREIQRAIDSGVVIEEAFVHQPKLQTPAGQAVLHRLREIGARLVTISDRVLEKIAYGERGDGLVVVARRPSHSLEQIDLGNSALVAVIEGLEKPGNIGAIVRSADGAGVRAVIVTEAAADPYGPNAIRASTGTIFSTRLVEATFDSTRDWCAEQGLQIVAATPHASRSYHELDYGHPTAVVLGSEARGLTQRWGDRAIGARVPMCGRADSLNVSVTAALFFYEALRQRGTM
ncbi:MAG: RNA methyltransferase [Phycisphaerae bacterium]|nr:RNA methyltransferase [Phycisphaerae bacterium]